MKDTCEGMDMKLSSGLFREELRILFSLLGNDEIEIKEGEEEKVEIDEKGK